MSKIKYLFVLLFLILVSPVHADTGIGLDSSKIPGGIKIDGSPGDIFGAVIKNTISILFTVGAMAFVIMTVWGAVDWILSGGDKEKVANARKRITTALTGLVLLSLSFVIMVILGQVLNIKFLETGEFKIPTLFNR